MVSILGILRNNLISRPWLRVRFSEVRTVRWYVPEDAEVNCPTETKQSSKTSSSIPPPFEVTTPDFEMALRRLSAVSEPHGSEKIDPSPADQCFVTPVKDQT